MSYRKRCKKKECPLWKSGVEVPFSGPVEPGGILLLGESPGFNEEREGKPFIGKAGQLGRRIGAEVGLNWSSCFIANSARCRIEKKDHSMQSITAILKCCRNHVEVAIQKTRPKLIVVLGDYALRQLTRKSGITKSRGKIAWSEEFQTHLLFSFHPSYFLRNPGKEGFLREDLAKAVSFMGNECQEQEEPTERDYREVADLRTVLKDGDVIGIDTESQGLDWTDPNFVMISVSVSPTKRVLPTAFNVTFYRENPPPDLQTFAKFPITWERAAGAGAKKKVPTAVWVSQTEDFDKKVEGLQWVLSNPNIKKYMHHGQYDIHALDAFFGRLGVGWELQGFVLDTQAAAHVLDENLFTLSSLETIQQFFTDEEDDSYKQEFASNFDKGDMLAIPEEERFIYAIKDALITCKAGSAILKQFGKEGRLLRYYAKLVHPTLLYSLHEMEKNGAYIDKDRLPSTMLEIGKLREGESIAAMRAVSPAVVERHKEKGLKLSRDGLIRDILFSKDGFGLSVLKKTDGGAESIDKDSRKALLDGQIPKKARSFLDHFNTWSELDTLYTRYLKGFDKSIKSDGRIHSSFSICATVTGRSSSKKPNMQTIPKRLKAAGAIRRLIAAPPGYLLIAADIAQSEIRWLAHVSQCKGLVNAFRRGEDIHVNVAKTLINWDKATEQDRKDARQKAKPVSFGIIYLISPTGLVQYAKSDYGVILSEKEAEIYIKKWFCLYPEVKEYQNRTIAMGRKRGYVESPLGRRRRLPELNSDNLAIRGGAERQAVNHPIQGPSSDVVLMAANEMLRTGKLPPDEIKLVLFVHDELVFEVRENLADKYVPVIKYALENPPLKRDFGVDLLVPLEAEVKIGKNLAEMREVQNTNVLQRPEA